jgi:3D (Asp-Asp-Asp) domain-containing protein/LysM repeat protein
MGGKQMKKTLLSLIAAAAISGAAGVNAQAEEVVVHKGDTLWKLSQKYGVSVQSLKEWNNLSSDVIYPNDMLEVSPVKSVLVREGDTLWGIGKAYGVSVAQLKEWNKLHSDIIIPGTQLAIYSSLPEKKNVQGATPAAAVPSNNQKETPAVQASSAPAKQSQSTQPQAVSGKEITVSATAYTADCQGCSGITKTGVNLKTNPDAKVIAVDPSVIPLGTRVYVQGYGYATAEDIGGAIKGNKIDVFIPDRQNALNWGRKQVKVTIID